MRHAEVQWLSGLLPGGGVGGGVGLPQQIAYRTVGYTAASRLFSNFGNPLPKSIQVEERKVSVVVLNSEQQKSH